MDADKTTLLGNIKSIPGRISGEISKLREKVRTFTVTGVLGGSYKLDTSKVDYSFARELYDNTHEKYKLGAWAAKPVINTCVGFMGVPRFKAVDEEVQEILDAFHSENVSLQQQTHRDALRDGDCWVWLTLEEDEETALLYPESKGFKLRYTIIPPEKIDHKRTKRDPITGRIIEYAFQSTLEWLDSNGNNKKCQVIERINKDERITEIIGARPEGLEPGVEPNNWGFIPIVQFSNEKDASAANGKSDLEPIEPFMKAYHDVMMHAIQGSKLHSTPKLQMKVKDVSRFLLNNFGITDPVKYAQEGKTITLEGKEVLFLQPEEEAGFIEVQSATGDAGALLKLLFMCIVDVSETPEFAFGVHTPSSQASVKEQMPVLVRRVARKREHFTGSWLKLARMVIAMHSLAGAKKFNNYETEILWDEIDPRDDKEVADALFVVVQALTLGVGSYLISEEAAVNYLAAYVDTMNDYVSDDPEVPGERERIISDRVRRGKLEDAPLMEDEDKLINQALNELEKSAKA